MESVDKNRVDKMGWDKECRGEASMDCGTIMESVALHCLSSLSVSLFPFLMPIALHCLLQWPFLSVIDSLSSSPFLHPSIHFLSYSIKICLHSPLHFFPSFSLKLLNLSVQTICPDIPEDEAQYWTSKLERINTMRIHDEVSLFAQTLHDEEKAPKENLNSQTEYILHN